MALDPRTPVVVGVGQVTDRPEPGADPTDRPEPVELMARAVAAAAEDAAGSGPGGEGGAGRRLLERTQSLRVVRPYAWEYVNPGLLVAERLGIAPPETMVSGVGGDDPQRILNRTALAIARGHLDVAVLTGADCGHALVAARRHPERPVLPWTTQAADAPRPTPLGQERAGTTAAEEERGLDLPVHIYPLFEVAVRAAAGRGLEEHRRHIGGLWARCSAVAAANPAAWLDRPYSAEEVATPADDNRMVAYPYTKLLTPDGQVDQGAAVLLCSAGAAAAAGIDRQRWVFPLAGADADDHWFLSHRADFHSSPALRLAGRSALALAGSGIDEVAHLDLFPCFPVVAEIAAAELGVAVDDPGRPLTVTGGGTFAGAPGANYATHAIAAMVGALRADPGARGVVTGVGLYLTQHSVGVYGTEPSPDGGVVPAGLPDRTEVAAAAGYRWAGPQGAVGALPQVLPDAEARGEVTVEAYAVPYSRDGRPARAAVACRTPDGRRAWATVTDPDHLAVLVTEEACGRLGTLRPDGEVDLS